MVRSFNKRIRKSLLSDFQLKKTWYICKANANRVWHWRFFILRCFLFLSKLAFCFWFLIIITYNLFIKFTNIRNSRNGFFNKVGGRKFEQSLVSNVITCSFDRANLSYVLSRPWQLAFASAKINFLFEKKIRATRWNNRISNCHLILSHWHNNILANCKQTDFSKC